MGGSPEERLEFFRGILKQKTETLARARTLYAEREAELVQLRAALEKARKDAATAGVVAKAGPFGEDVFIARCRERGDGRPALDEPLETGPHGGDRGLLEHDLAQPDPIRIGRRFAGWRAPRQAPEVIHIMLEQGRGGIGGHLFAMACSRAMSKNKQEDSPRSCRARAAGDLVGDIGGVSFRRFGFIQSSIVSRWGEIVGERYGRVSSPESIKFPTGRKGGGVLTLLVDGAHAPLIQHLTPMIVERVNRFFGYAAIDRIVFRQGKPPAPAARAQRPALRPVPRSLAKDCAKSPIPNCAPAWSCLPLKLPLAAARRPFRKRMTFRFP